jgi:hypothetical protein
MWFVMYIICLFVKHKRVLGSQQILICQVKKQWLFLYFTYVTLMDSQWASDKHPHATQVCQMHQSPSGVSTTSSFAWIASVKSRTQGRFAYSWVQRRSNRTQNPLMEPKQFILSCHVPGSKNILFTKSSRLTQYLGPWWPLPPTTAEVKIEWSCTSTPPTCLRGLDRVYFLFTSSEY